VAGVETAGIPHSSALAFHARLPSVFVRKQPKDHGLRRRVEGGDVAGRRVLLVEDMVTTGASSLAAVEALREADAQVTDCLAIVSYGFPEAQARFTAAGVTLHVLVPAAALIDQAAADGRIDGPTTETVRAWLADPHGWGAPA
jgi:orotate phosphoribosyltransferase